MNPLVNSLLRIEVKRRLIDWGLVERDHVDFSRSDHPASLYLCQLFGYEKYEVFCHATNDDPALLARLRLLASENGYCLIKAMKARI